MESPIVILYTKEEWLNATKDSIKELGMTNPIIEVEGTFNAPLKPYQIVSYIFKNKILPIVKGLSFFYTEEGTLWRTIPKETINSKWYGYTKLFKNGRIVGAKCLYFSTLDTNKLEQIFEKYYHIDLIFSKCDWLKTANKNEFIFKLYPRPSYFNTKHSKKYYE